MELFASGKLMNKGNMYIAGSEDHCAYIVDSHAGCIVDVLPVPGVAWSV